MIVDDTALILVGCIGRAHGVRGEVKVYPETDTPERFLELETLYVGTSSETARPLAVEAARFQHKKGGQLIVLLKLGGVDDRDEAQTFNAQKLFALEDHLPPLEEGEIYLQDLIGFDVFEREGEGDELLFRGTVADVIDEQTAQLLFLVRREGAPDVLVPDVDPIVEKVDLEERRIVVTPPEGLFRV